MTIIKELQDKEISEEGSISFVCETSSPVPPSYIRWEKNHAPLVENNNCKISHEGNKYKVILTQVQAADEGYYTCKIAVNDNMQVYQHSRAHLTVKSRLIHSVSLFIFQLNPSE